MDETVGEPEDGTEALLARLEAAENRLRDIEASTQKTLVQACLRADALRAGMIDLDGLKLLDLDGVSLDDKGEVVGAARLMSELKRAKPWLFGGHSSSSRSAVPPATPPKTKLATEMSTDEWRAARAELLRHRR